MKINATINYLKKKKKILFLTTSNRWEKGREKPKSTELALLLAKKLGKKVRVIDVSKIKIYPCEGNVSSKKGNYCGVKGALLKDKRKNPSQNHRCWASINNKDDELWKITKKLFDSDVILFFGSVRWGNMDSIYQRLIERLTFIENRHSTLKGENILKGKEVGVIAIGHNWNGENVIKTQKKVLKFFGFDTPKELSWNWQYTENENDESQENYKKAYLKFEKELNSK
ncbi:flavodoxin family protein [archaeon]|nr:flavodoxin family protein [archaeon]